jgi:hypothetical protein
MKDPKMQLKNVYTTSYADMAAKMRMYTRLGEVGPRDPRDMPRREATSDSVRITRQRDIKISTDPATLKDPDTIGKYNKTLAWVSEIVSILKVVNDPEPPPALAGLAGSVVVLLLFIPRYSGRWYRTYEGDPAAEAARRCQMGPRLYAECEVGGVGKTKRQLFTTRESRVALLAKYQLINMLNTILETCFH